MDIAAIRQGIKDAIAQVEGIRVTNLRDDPHPPCAIVYPKAPFPLTETFDATSRPQFLVLVLVPYVNTTAAQDKLDEYISDNGPRSLKVAIEKDQTLGETVAECLVTDLETYGVIQLLDGGTRFLSAELVVDVWTKGSD